MKFSLQDFLNHIVLNDCRVKSITLDIVKFEFEIIFEDAFWIKNNSSDELDTLNNGFLKIKNYIAFEARYFSKDTRLWETLDYKNLDMIKEVNEKYYSNNILTLSGFGKRTGEWIEYKIDGGDHQIEFGF